MDSIKLISGKYNEQEKLWLLLSYFYLDTELTDSVLIQIIKEIDELPFERQHVKQVLRAQVTPVLKLNLILPTGEYNKFDEERTLGQIKKFIRGFWYKLFYASKLKKPVSKLGYVQEYWDRIEKLQNR